MRKNFLCGMMILSFLAVAGVLTGDAAFGADPVAVTVYGDSAYPPYSYAEEGNPAGIYTEILRRAFDRMEGYDVAIELVPWKRGLAYIERGTGFALYPPYYFPEKRPFMKPYSVPILEETTVVFCREEVLKEPRPNWPGDYYGLSVGINSGYAFGGEDFWQAVEEGKIKMDQSTKETRTNVLKLINGRIDCYMNDRNSILWELQKLKDEGRYDEARHGKILEGTVIASEQGYLAFTDRDNGAFPFKADFVKKFNAAIEEMKANGEIQKVTEAFFK